MREHQRMTLHEGRVVIHGWCQYLFPVSQAYFSTSTFSISHRNQSSLSGPNCEQSNVVYIFSVPQDSRPLAAPATRCRDCLICWEVLPHKVQPTQLCESCGKKGRTILSHSRGFNSFCLTAVRSLCDNREEIEPIRQETEQTGRSPQPQQELSEASEWFSSAVTEDASPHVTSHVSQTLFDFSWAPT